MPIQVWCRTEGNVVFVYVYSDAEHYAFRYRLTYGANGLNQSTVIDARTAIPQTGLNQEQVIALFN